MRRFGQYAALLLLSLGACRVSYTAFRRAQSSVHEDNSWVTRVYIDRYGDLYPDTAVTMSPSDFRIDGRRRSKTLAGLSHYFLSDPAGLKKLKEFYGISPDSTAREAYRESQRRILKNYNGRIEENISLSHADKLIYRVHGFNDTLAETECSQMRQAIAARHYPDVQKPVYVDIHWGRVERPCR